MTPFSIVIPIHNEASILRECLSHLLKEFEALGAEHEIILCENGSTDDTWKIALDFQRRHPQIRSERLHTPNYGLALKHAISRCRHPAVLVFNIDFWSADFASQAIRLLDQADMVIGSKVVPGAVDQRPMIRRIITRSFNAFLKMAFHFRGTDTHGMKAFRIAPLSDVLAACVTDHFILDTELVLRAHQNGLRIVEIPVCVSEIRHLSGWSLMKRTPQVIRNLVKLRGALLRPGSP